MSIRLIQSGLLSATAALLIACGGGGGGGGGNASTPPPPPSLSGIAAIGAAMANATVTLKDSNGKTATATTDKDGNFSFSNVGGFTPPIMLRASGAVNNQSYTLHSLLTSVQSTGNINLNVTPATEALTAQTLGGTPASAFETSGSGFMEAKSADLAAAKAKLMAALQDTLLALGLDTEVVDLMTSKFAANNEGVDKLLDLVGFSADNSNGDIKIKDKKPNSNGYTTIRQADSIESISKINVSVGGVTPLNTDGIDNLIKRLIAASNNNTNPSMNDFDDEYLFQGITKTILTNQSSSNTTSSSNNFTIDSKYKIKKCDQAAKVCYVGLQLKTKSSEIALMNIDMGVKQDNLGNWKLYGDQAHFVYRSTPVFMYGESASGTGTFKNGYLKNAVAITFPGTACNGCTEKVYERALIEISYDGKNYTDSLTIRAGELSLFENNSSFRNDLLPTFSNDTAKKLNDANQTGKLKIRITAYSKKLGEITWEPPTFPLLFSSETEVKEFMKEKNWGIRQGLTTRSVTFTGEGILSVFAALKHPSYPDFFTIPYLASNFSAKQITPLNNEDSCSIVKNSFFQSRMTCDAFFNNSIIMTAGLISSDAKGRGIVYLKVP